MRKPSVSELLDLLAKPALIGWANKQGLAGIDTTALRKEKMARGTDMHSKIERALTGRGEIENAEHRASYERFMDDKIFIAAEKEIETEWFVGRYDARIECEDGEYIVDLKRGHKGKLYLENKLQLIAYTMAEPAKMAIVGVPSFLFTPFDPANRAPYEKILIHLAEIWELKREIEHV